MTDAELLDLAARIAARPQGRAVLELLADAPDEADVFLEGALRLFLTARPHETPAFLYLGTFPKAPLEALDDPAATDAELAFAERVLRGSA